MDKENPLQQFTRCRDALLQSIAVLTPDANCDGFSEALASMASLRQAMQRLMDQARAKQRRLSVPTTQVKRKRKKRSGSVRVVNTGQSRIPGSHRGPR